jgi:hypothetical protein
MDSYGIPMYSYYVYCMSTMFYCVFVLIVTRSMMKQASTCHSVLNLSQLDWKS